MNLNDPEQFTSKNLSALLAAGDPSRRCQLRVLDDGTAYLSTDKIGNVGLEGVVLHLPTWLADSGYVGPEAARDRQHVAWVMKILRAHWPRKGNGPSVFADSW